MGWVVGGFAALGLLAAWLRIVVGWFGPSGDLAVVVLASVLGAAALGAGSSRAASRVLVSWSGTRDPVRLAGGLALATALLALLTPVASWLPAEVWNRFPYHADGNRLFPPLSLLVARALLVVICVTPPSFMMGATFPLICSSGRGDAHFPARLVATGALGGCLALGSTHLLLFPSVGHGSTFLLMVLVLSAIAILGLLPRPAGPDLPADHSPSPGSVSFDPKLLLWMSVLAGILTGAVTADLQEKVEFLGTSASFGRTLVTFWALAGLGLAAASATGASAPSWGRVKLLFVAGAVLHWMTWDHVYMVRDWLVACDLAPADAGWVPRDYRVSYFPSRWWQLPALVGFLVFPTSFLMSSVLPFLLNRAHADGGRVEGIVATHGLAFAASVVLFSAGAPRVDVFYSFKLMSAFLVIGTLALVAARDRWSAWHPPLVALSMAMAARWVSPGFDVTYVNPRSLAAIHPVVAMRSDGGDTTFVVDDEDGRRLNVNNYCTASVFPTTYQYQRLMAHMPLLLHPDPRTALVVGFGCGSTAGAISLHESIEKIDVVEPNPGLFETASAFASHNADVGRDARTTWIHDDVRSVLARGDRRYDLVTGSPPPPMMAGVHRLYSVDYYRAVLGVLTPRGLMSQWLPLDQLSPLATDRVLRSFLAVFPHAGCFVGHERQLILVGSPSELDVTEVARRLGGSGRAAGDLRALGIPGMVELLARWLASDRQLRERVGPGPTIVDERNDLDHLLRNAWQHAVIEYEPWGLLRDLRAERLALHDELRHATTHLGRLVYRVPDFPLKSLLSVRPDPASPVGLAGMDWSIHHHLMGNVRRLQKYEDISLLADMLEALIHLSPELPWAQLQMARVFAGSGDRVRALQHVRLFQDLEPGDVDGSRLRLALDQAP